MLHKSQDRDARVPEKSGDVGEDQEGQSCLSKKTKKSKKDEKIMNLVRWK